MLDKRIILNTFRAPTQPYQRMLGFEQEVFCLDRQRLEPLRYAALQRILAAACELVGGTLVSAPVCNKAQLADGALLSLEPGGQLEFSSAPQPTFAGCVAQHALFQSLLSRLQEQLGFAVFFGGANPVHTVEQIGLVVATDRYRLMDARLPAVGPRARQMMRQTASTQVVFDYVDHQDAGALLRAALHVAPFAAAMLAHSPFLDGRRSGFRSVRVPIWQGTDPTRTGLCPGFDAPEYGLAEYVDFVLDAPLLFVETAAGLEDAGRVPFREFATVGLRGQVATLQDFELHASTIFTDVRARQTIEVRSVDGQDPALVPAAIALLAGLLLAPASRGRAIELVGGVPAAQRPALALKLAREGLAADVGGRSARDVALDLLAIAREGLLTTLTDGALACDHLEPLAALVADGMTPADVVLARHADPASWLAAGRTFAVAPALPPRRCG